MFGDGGYETTSNWNYKIIGRYVMPYDIGFSGSWKVQSGYQWGRVTSVAFPGDGAQNVRMEPVTSNRAPNVAIMDVRLDKAIKFGKFGKITGQLDVFNLMNSGTITVFRTDDQRHAVQGSARHPRPARRPLRRAVRLLVDDR